MSDEDVKRVVQITIKELCQKGLVQAAESYAYKEISDRLFGFWMPAEKPDFELDKVLKKLESDPYYFVILLFYRDRCTIETIAERMSVDVRTVSRNKKRLCIAIYTMLETT